MNRRNAAKHIAKKVKDWLDSLPKDIRKKIEKKVIVTGGSIVSLLLGERVNDFDIYFRDMDAANLVAEHYAKFFTGSYVMNDCGQIKIITPSEGVQERDVDKEKKYQPVFLSENAITLTNRVQVILRFYGKPEEIHENYDYIHCTNYWTPEGFGHGTLVLQAAALESILTKELIYTGSLYPVYSLFRLRKFLKKGWTINAGQMLKIVFQCSELNLEDTRVLREQLIGVDVAYFIQVLEIIAAEKEKDEYFKISGSFLAEVVDRIFHD